MNLFEFAILLYRIRDIDGPLKLDKGLLKTFLFSMGDPLPNFQGVNPRKSGRTSQHPRFGRWVYAFTKFYKPDIIVEVGTHTGGTAVGWARALKENEKGKLICIDNDTYAPGAYPAMAKRNIREVGLEESRFDLKCGDSKEIVPKIAKGLKGKVDIYLVDGDHHYEGALADIENGLPMLKSGGFLLIHDIDINLKMIEATESHPYPVYEAFKKAIGDYGFEWCILRFIRTHLGIIKIVR